MAFQCIKEGYDHNKGGGGEGGFPIILIFV